MDLVRNRPWNDRRSEGSIGGALLRQCRIGAPQTPHVVSSRRWTPPKRGTHWPGRILQRFIALVPPQIRPVRSDRVEPVEIARSSMHSNQPLLPWHLRASEIPPGGDLVTGRHTLLCCETVTICYASADANSELYRNTIGDELLFIQTGKATLESAFGRLVASAGDYVVVPGSTTHRWIIEPQAAPVQALVLEARGHIGLPERYLTKTGQLREGAPFCERDIRPPGDLIFLEGEDVPVIVRTAQWLV